VAERRLGDDRLKQAAREGLAEGLRLHLPGAVGIVTKGIPLCAAISFAHFVLGMGLPGSAISTVVAGIGPVWVHAHRRDQPQPR
jgi:hypothetical protein